MAKNAKLTIVEVWYLPRRILLVFVLSTDDFFRQAENIVPIGSISPNAIHLPSIYVDRIIRATAPKQIETIALSPSDDTPPPSPSDAPSPSSSNLLVFNENRHRIAKRAAKEIQDGFHVNLGIGLPVLVTQYLEPGMRVWLQSENGILGMGPYPTKAQVDA